MQDDFCYFNFVLKFSHETKANNERAVQESQLQIAKIIMDVGKARQTLCHTCACSQFNQCPLHCTVYGLHLPMRLPYVVRMAFSQSMQLCPTLGLARAHCPLSVLGILLNSCCTSVNVLKESHLNHISLMCLKQAQYLLLFIFSCFIGTIKTQMTKAGSLKAERIKTNNKQ